MRPTVVALTALLLATPALAGCLAGTSPDVTPGTIGDDGDPFADAPTRAVVHTAGTSEAPGTLLDDDRAFGDGVPLPVGAARSTGFTAFEPTIGVTSDGTLFMSNFGGSFATGWISVVRSQDQGATWEEVTPSLGPLSSPLQSNDPYVYVDPGTDRVYNLDMQGLQCNWVQWSDDAGETWTTNPLGCGQPPLLDHPTLFAGPARVADPVGYDHIVHLCVNRVADSACSHSLDGGLTWTPFTTVFPGADPARVEADPADPVATVFSGFCGGLHAHGVVGPEGRVYLPKGQCGVPTVAISEDDGLTWELVPISEEVGVKGHEVAIDVDADGNAYAFWIAPDRKPYLAVSTDGGRSWGDAMMVAPPGVATTDFPTLAVGDAGRVAVAYVGTEADKEYGDMADEDSWNAYLTITTDALADVPVFATAPANDPADPIARGVCGNSRCFGDSGGALGDFIDVVVDGDGRPWAAFVDVCTEDCVNSTDAGNDHGLGFVGTLAVGPSLRGNGTALAPLADAADVGADA